MDEEDDEVAALVEGYAGSVRITGSLRQQLKRA